MKNKDLITFKKDEEIVLSITIAVYVILLKPINKFYYEYGD
jgi:hypothetical protein